MLMRRIVATVASGGALSALLTAGWAGAAVVAAVVVVLTLAVCWTIADPDRPGRLALLFTAWRGLTNDEAVDDARAHSSKRARCDSGTRST